VEGNHCRREDGKPAVVTRFASEYANILEQREMYGLFKKFLSSRLHRMECVIVTFIVNKIHRRQLHPPS